MIAGIAAGSKRQDHCGWTGGIAYAGESLMGDVDSELVMAARHVAEARRIVALQRARVIKLRALGRATPDHELTLQALVGTLGEMECYAHALVKTAKRFERRRLMS